MKEEKINSTGQKCKGLQSEVCDIKFKHTLDNFTFDYCATCMHTYNYVNNNKKIKKERKPKIKTLNKA